MSDESSDRKNNQDAKLMEQAKQLLHLTEIVETYPEVIGRRVTGILYLLIGGGTSFITLVFMSLMIFVDNLGENILVILGFVVVSLLVAWFMTAKMIRSITKSYPPELQDEMSTTAKVVWGTIAIIMIISAVILFS
ncbi:MAG: hypothetical protein GF411_01820, partial [Candidatus Lokiarchaeota archaeon]|nr:hypothetical protein [Candidatus Lokiarchaeota archaeon]